MSTKLLTSIAAVAGAAALTLGSIGALVQGTIFAVSIANVTLRILAAALDVILGTLLLVGCIYLATRWAVRIVGVGNVEFPSGAQRRDGWTDRSARTNANSGDS